MSERDWVTLRYTVVSFLSNDACAHKDCLINFKLIKLIAQKEEWFIRICYQKKVSLQVNTIKT